MRVREDVQPTAGSRSDTFSIPRLGETAPGTATAAGFEAPQAVTPSGALSFSIPLPDAPARGASPGLSLLYSSNAGNGLFGHGWALPMSFVGHHPREGLPRYDGTDIYALDGGEELVPVPDADTPGAPLWQDTATIAGQGYLIHRFRKRVDGDLGIVERYTRTADGDVHWRVLDGNGGVRVYGQDPAARLADPSKPRRVFRWLIERTYDVSGNVTLYDYVAEDDRGVSGHSGVNRHLKSVRFGALAPYDPLTEALPDFAYHLVFDYGDHAGAAPGLQPDTDWAARGDPLSDRRGGFELRTNRLCQRVLLFHDLPELGNTPTLTQSVGFTYDLADGCSRLTAAAPSWYRRLPAGGYETEGQPPITLGYSDFEHDLRTDPLVAAEDTSLPGLVEGPDEAQRVWADLAGTGLPGILSDDGGTLRFARNLGAGRFGAAEPLGQSPVAGVLGAGRLAIEPIDRDGRIGLTLRTDAVQGYFELDETGAAQPFQSFDSQVTARSPDARVLALDATGDGYADLLDLGEETVLLAPGRGKAGTGAFAETGSPHRPNVQRTGQARAILLADMTGDGLTDLVEVGPETVIYWPALGHGRFDAPVHMGDVPILAAPDGFDPARVRLASLSGAGPADLIYFGEDRLIYALNTAGRRFAAPRTGPGTGRTGPGVSAQVIDLVGSGVPALVLPETGGAAARYLRPAGALRPHLLTAVLNGKGGENRIGYTGSADLAAAALAAGKPWLGTPPFTVICVTRIEQTDHLRGMTYTQRFDYAHAFFDPEEREFRGFARVDQWDGSEAEEAAGAAPDRPAEAQPVIHVRTWYDTGLPPENPVSPQRIAAEWWDGGGADLPWRPAQPALPDAAPPAHLRRARRGTMLRSETYELDGSAAATIPHATVTAATTAICLAKPDGARPAVVRGVPDTTISVTWERQLDAPQISQTTTLEADALGHVIRAATVSYGRETADSGLPPSVRGDQARTLVDISEKEFTADTLPAGAQRSLLRRRAWRSKAWVLQGITPPAGTHFTGADLQSLYDSAPEVQFAAPTGITLAKRLTGESRKRYLADDLTAELGDGVLGRLPIVERTYTLVLTPDLRSTVWDADFASDADLAAAGYLDLDSDGRWWRPSGRFVRGAAARARFLQPGGSIDAAGVTLDLFYDPHNLFVTRKQDALGNETLSEIDYRTGSVVRQTDPNGTIAEVAHDVQGRIIAQALRGPAGEGDTLADPTLTISYDDRAFALTGRPTSRRMRMRERHADAGARWFERVAYMDGLGETLQARSQAAPGAADVIGGTGQLASIDTGAAPRWRVQAKPRLTQKGKAVGGFDPWFSDSDAYDDDPRLTERGGGSTDRLDGLGRVERTDYANGSFSTSAQTPWQSTASDQNDTSRDSQWYLNRGAPDPAAAEPVGDAAFGAWVAAKHHGTASEIHMDAGGGHIFEREPLENGAVQTLRTARVPGGHLTQSFDSDDREVSASYSDLSGDVMRLRTMEDGDSQILHDAEGRRMRLKRPDGTVHEILHDVLGRPLGVRSTPPGGGAPRVESLTIYGDGHADAGADNLRTRPIAVLDGSGMTRMRRYEFKGALAEAEKMYLADPLNPPDYSGLIGLAADQAIAAAEALMTAERFTSTTVFDAMGRSAQCTTPDGAVLDQTHGPDGALDRLRLTPGTGAPARDVVTSETHDAHGALIETRLGDGTTLTQQIDPAMRYLTRQTVTRDADNALMMDVGFERDAVGNITSLQDAAAPEIFFANAVTDGSQRYEYDALYRLTRATGRELAALSNSPWAQETGVGLPHQNNASAVHRYTRRFSYDLHGNITEIHHSAGGQQWRRRMRYGPASNRLEAVSAPGDAAGVFSQVLTYDAQGRMTGGAGLGPLSWSGGGQLTQADLGGGGTAHYITGAGGTRVRKIIDRPGGIRDDWLYLGAVEIHRHSVNGVLQQERHTHKVMSGDRLLMRLETKTVDVADPAAPTAPLWRFRHEDLTGSITLETTETGAVILLETFHPFGTTAYRSGASAAEVSLSRYRFSSRETDAESGLVAVGHRYYARWLGRWISPDPAGPINGPNTYAYCMNNPVMYADSSGLDREAKAQALLDKGAKNWTWEDVQFAAEYLGGTISPRVNAENYHKFWTGSKWAVLVEDFGPATGDAQTAGPGGAAAADEQKPPGGGETGGGKGEDKKGDADGSGDAATPDGKGDAGKGDGGKGDADSQGSDPDAATKGKDDDGVDIKDVRNPGATAVSTYNSVQRSKYAKGNIERAKGAVNKIEAAIKAGDEATAWAEAEKASNGRADARDATQKKMKYTGGKQLSDVIDGKRDFPKSKAHYSKGANPKPTWLSRKAWNFFTPGLPEHTPGPRGGSWQRVTRDIAIGSGKTNRVMSGFSKFGKVAGPIGTAWGVGVGVYNYVNAPPEQKTRVAVGETASFVGGALGFAGGSALAAAAIGFFVSNPVGWVAGLITVTVLAVGALGAWIGSKLFRSGAERTYDYATGR